MGIIKTRASLWRYTNLPSLLHILNNRHLTLLDPSTWDDSNDAYAMAQYKDKIQAKSVLAQCFSIQNDTYHHWSIFSGKDSGVRIEFDKHLLLNSLNGKKHYRAELVSYKKISDIPKYGFKTKDLPFLKRVPYEAEKEFRVIYESKNRALASKSWPIDLKWIKRVTINPWMAKPLADITKNTIKKINGCEELKVVRSTVTDNARWKKAAKNAD